MLSSPCVSPCELRGTVTGHRPGVVLDPTRQRQTPPPGGGPPPPAPAPDAAAGRVCRLRVEPFRLRRAGLAADDDRALRTRRRHHLDPRVRAGHDGRRETNERNRE